MSQITPTLALYLPMLKPSADMAKTYCFDIGRALFSLYQVSPPGLEEWQAVYKDDKVLSVCCKASTYASFEHSYITTKTIQWYARQDSPIEYAKVLKSRLTPYMDKMYAEGYGVLTSVLAIMYELEIVCCRGNWYRFTNHHWVKVDEAAILDFIRADFAIQAPKLEIINPDVNLTTRFNYATIITGAFNNAKIQFEDSKFEGRLDRSSSSVVAFTNGVIDTFDGTTLFRPGKPEDYCADNMGLEYTRVLSLDHLQVKSTSTDTNLASLASSLIGKVLSKKKASSPSSSSTESKENSLPITPRRSPRSRAQVFSFDSSTLQSPTSQAITPQKQRLTSMDSTSSST